MDTGLREMCQHLQPGAQQSCYLCPEPRMLIPIHSGNKSRLTVDSPQKTRLPSFFHVLGHVLIQIFVLSSSLFQSRPWKCPGRLLSAFVAAVDGSKVFQAALVLLQAGRQQMENKRAQELWGWCCRRWRAAECRVFVLPAPGCSRVAGQAAGSWGMCQGLAGTEGSVLPALCPSLLSHQPGPLSLPPSCPFPFRVQSGNVWKLPEPFWGCSEADITLMSPVGAWQRDKLRHRTAGMLWKVLEKAVGSVTP